MARVQPDASISANERLVPHLSTRTGVWVFPRGVGESQYVLELLWFAKHVPRDRSQEVARDHDWVLWRFSP